MVDRVFWSFGNRLSTVNSLATHYTKRWVFIRIVITRTGPAATDGHCVNYSRRLFYRRDAWCTNTERYRGYISSFPRARGQMFFFAFLNSDKILMTYWLVATIFKIFRSFFEIFKFLDGYRLLNFNEKYVLIIKVDCIHVCIVT